MAKLILIRHGQSKWNALNLFNGWIDTNLSEKGREQAKTAGKLLLNENIKFDQAYTSVLTRAIDTLHLVLDEANQIYIPETKSWRLNERHYGALQGLNKQDAADKWGQDQVFEWRRSYDTLPPLLTSKDEYMEVLGQKYPSFDRRYSNVEDKDLPYGENLKITLERVLPFWNSNIEKDLKNNKNVIIAAHGNSLRAIVKHLENISDEDILKVEIGNGEPWIYDLDENMNLIVKKIISYK